MYIQDAWYHDAMKTIFGLVILALLGAGAYWYYQNNMHVATQPDATQTPATSTPEVAAPKTEESIGKSAEGRDITAYHFGSGTTTILFIGGIHGGYEWNTSLVAYELMDYLRANPLKIPANVKVTVIPVVNPDGLAKVVATTTQKFSAADVNKSQSVQVSGRFNANSVDLNRNFDCDWKSEGVWQNKSVSGGTSVFSEPESMAMKSYIEKVMPAGVVVWYSSAGGVYASNCHDGVLSETTTLTDAYAKASGYPAHKEWDYYEVTGDMVNWLAKIKIPAISVLLTNHTDTEWTKNQKGVEAVLSHFGN